MFKLIVRPKLFPGFTLMELLVSIAIFLVITSFVVFNFRNGQWRDELRKGADVVATSLREMQTKTNSGTKVICPNILGETEPSGGYGMLIDNNIPDSPELLLFADCGDFNPLTPHMYDGEATDTLLASLSLPTHIELVSLIMINIDNSEGTAPTLNTTFSNSSEVVWLNSKIPTSTEGYAGAVVELHHTLSGKDAEVQINSYTGQINVIIH